MQKLSEIIKTLDGKSVSTYTKLSGRYERNNIVYNFKNVYGGQFKYAQVNIEFPLMYMLGDYSYSDSDKVAISSFIMREFSVATHLANDVMQQSESNVQKGLFVVYKFGTRVLQNSVVQFGKDSVTVSLTVKLPFNNTAYNTGRRADELLGIKAQSGSVLALSEQARKDSFNNRKKGIISARALKLLLTKNLPTLAEDFLANFDTDSLYNAVCLWRNQEFIRIFLKQNGYVAFLANGSILPRKGKTDYKDSKNAVPFRSPKSMEISIPLPDGNLINGMAIPRGITLITGDAYHGKSTIIEAIKQGVYNHVWGDGREYVITEQSAETIQAEDGRSIRNTDISFFLKNLPVKNLSARSFCTDNASGSTSQAAAVTEALEAKCSLMLFDEDRSANNFMYKDEKMRLVIKDASTCPFIDNAQMFYHKHGISSIIVVGASGEYFRIADKIILVHNFTVSEYTDYNRINMPKQIDFCPSKRFADLSDIGKICLSRNIEIKDDSTIKLGNEIVNILEIIPNVTRGQLDFICSFLYCFTVFEVKTVCTLCESVIRLYEKIEAQGIQSIHQTGLRGSSGVIEYVRTEDILALIYRLKAIRFQ